VTSQTPIGTRIIQLDEAIRARVILMVDAPRPIPVDPVPDDMRRFRPLRVLTAAETNRAQGDVNRELKPPMVRPVMERIEQSSWWSHPYHRRFVAGFVLVGLGLMWRIQGPIGHVEVYNERLPDIRQADFIIVPLIGLGLMLVSSRPGVRLVDRVIGTGLILIAGAWLVTRHPLQGRIIWSGPSQHGLHLGDVLSAIPGLLGLQILLRSPVPGTRSDPAIRAARHAGSPHGASPIPQMRTKDPSR
jgi:hypothetical protein